MGHTAPVTSVSLAESGSKVVSASYDLTLRVWDATKGLLLNTLTGHTSAVNCVQCEGGMIVSASSDNSLKVWDLRSPSSAIKTFNGTFSFYGLGWVRFYGLVLMSHSVNSFIQDTSVMSSVVT
jgi:WD40 repeat protein